MKRSVFAIGLLLALHSWAGAEMFALRAAGSGRLYGPFEGVKDATVKVSKDSFAFLPSVKAGDKVLAFSLKATADGKLYGPFEFNTGAKVILGDAGYTMVVAGQAKSAATKAPAKTRTKIGRLPWSPEHKSSGRSPSGQQLIGVGFGAEADANTYKQGAEIEDDDVKGLRRDADKDDWRDNLWAFRRKAFRAARSSSAGEGRDVATSLDEEFAGRTVRWRLRFKGLTKTDGKTRLEFKHDQRRLTEEGKFRPIAQFFPARSSEWRKLAEGTPVTISGRVRHVGIIMVQDPTQKKNNKKKIKTYPWPTAIIDNVRLVADHRQKG